MGRGRAVGNYPWHVLNVHNCCRPQNRAAYSAVSMFSLTIASGAIDCVVDYNEEKYGARMDAASRSSKMPAMS